MPRSAGGLRGSWFDGSTVGTGLDRTAPEWTGHPAALACSRHEQARRQRAVDGATAW
ncbi:hypothetical protein ACWD8L_04070 [Streptomyces sp. NPDC005133]